MKLLSFELTMPNVGSWNGKWTGSERKYFVVESTDNKTAESIMKGKQRQHHYYNFGDGWGANVTVEIVDSAEAKRRRKISSGFSGYEWMIDSIKMFDEILNTNQRKERLSI